MDAKRNGTHPLDTSLPYPGLPIPKPCLSIWQRTTRNNAMTFEGSTGDLPSEAECIIIGSGIAGALTAYELLSQPNGPKNVVMLEAREAVSGASGRNAGHCRPDAFRGFTAFSELHGAEQAMKIIAHERLVLQLVKAFIDKHNVNCEFDCCGTFDVIMAEGFQDYVMKSWETYKKAGGNTEGITFLDKEEARKVTRVPEALGAFEWEAANLHPAKLCLALLALGKAKGLSLYTQAPVTSVLPALSSTAEKPMYEVHTTRGVVTSPIIIHATNAHCGTLVPALGTHIMPTRAHAQKIIPTTSFSGNNMITHTYSLRYTLQHFYSLIQRKADGAVVLGSSRGIPGLQDVIKKESIGSKNDQGYNQEIADDAMSAFSNIFKGEWEDELRMGEGTEIAWTGIIAMTTDAVPFIGQVPGSPGQWVMAGFNGHGMARIFGCAPGLAKLVVGGKWSDTGMPECFEITEARLARLAKA